jgi:hypothetical protein
VAVEVAEDELLKQKNLQTLLLEQSDHLQLSTAQKAAVEGDSS